MDVSQVLDQADPAASVVVAMFGVVGAGWAVRRFLHRPKLKCGIPPTKADRCNLGSRYGDDRLGRPSLTRAYRHRRRCFPCKLWGRDRRSLPGLLRWWLVQRRNTRAVQPGPDGLVHLPIVLLNDGARTAKDLSASIIIHTPGAGPTLRLKHVIAESLDFHIYASDRARLDPAIQDKAAPLEIVNTYQRDLDYARFQDGVWLFGLLTAHTYELIHVVAEPDDGLERFFLIYTTNCDDGWSRASAFIQCCQLDRVPPPTRADDRAAATRRRAAEVPAAASAEDVENDAAAAGGKIGATARVTHSGPHATGERLIPTDAASASPPVAESLLQRRWPHVKAQRRTDSS